MIPDDPHNRKELARRILAMEFGPEIQSRVQALGIKANVETLSADEQEEINIIENAGQLLRNLQSKARDWLKEPPPDTPPESGL